MMYSDMRHQVAARSIVYIVWKDLVSLLTVMALVPLLVLILTPTGGGAPHPFVGVIIGHKTLGHEGVVSLALQLIHWRKGLMR